MSLTAAQLAWLAATGVYRCALFELTFLGNASGTPTEMHAYVANYPYISHATDAIPNQIFDECVIEIPAFVSRMGEQLEGRTQQSTGDLILFNGNVLDRNQQRIEGGDRDAWYAMNWDGRRARMWLGDPSWAMADFIPFERVIGDVFDPGSYKIGFHLGDKETLLDRPIIVDTMGGDGPEADGIDPIILGKLVSNIPLKLLDSATLTYRASITSAKPGHLIPLDCVEYLPTDGTEVVLENGGALDSTGSLSATAFGTDLFTVAGHGASENTRFRLLNLGGATAPGGFAFNTNYWIPASGLTVNDFKGAATRGGSPINMLSNHTGSILVQFFNWTLDSVAGTVQLAAQPADSGKITMSIGGLRAGAAGTTEVATAGGVIEQVMASGLTNRMVSADDIDLASLAAFKAACPNAIGTYSDQRLTFADLFDKLVLSVGGWRNWSDDALLQFGRLDIPAAGTPVYSFIDDDRRSMKLLRRILPRIEIRLRADVNYSPLQQITGGVDPVTAETLRRPYREYVGSVAASGFDDPINHIRALRPAAFDTLLVYDGQQDETDRLAALFQYPCAIFGFETHQIAWALSIGSLIYVEAPKYTGYGTVVGLEKRVKGRSIVEFFCQLPDVNPTADIA